jgi:DNA-binding NarL/FixJ family response regulator
MSAPRAQSSARAIVQASARKPLTRRESQVLRLLAAGLSQKEIARALELSHHTIDSHVRKIYRKLKVSSRVAAVTLAIRADLV